MYNLNGYLVKIHENKTLESLKCIYDMWIFISLKKFFTEFFLEKLWCLASVFFTSKNRRYRGNLQLIQRFLTLLSRFKLLKYLIFFEVFNYSQKNSFNSSFFIHIVKNYKRCYEILKWTTNVIGVCANFMYGIYKLRSVILITRLRNN